MNGFGDLMGNLKGASARFPQMGSRLQGPYGLEQGRTAPFPQLHPKAYQEVPGLPMDQLIQPYGYMGAPSVAEEWERGQWQNNVNRLGWQRMGPEEPYQSPSFQSPSSNLEFMSPDGFMSSDGFMKMLPR